MQQPSILCIVLANGVFVKPAVKTKLFPSVFIPALLTQKSDNYSNLPLGYHGGQFLSKDL